MNPAPIPAAASPGGRCIHDFLVGRDLRARRPCTSMPSAASPERPTYLPPQLREARPGGRISAYQTGRARSPSAPLATRNGSRRVGEPGQGGALGDRALPTPRRGTPPGFTLIEVLLAVAIFGIVLVAIHGIFHGALRLRNRTVDSIEGALPLEQALTLIRRDLAGIVAPGGTFGGAVQSSPVVEGLLGQPTVQFTTASGIISDTSPWGEVQRVTYLLSAATNRSVGKDLHRAVTRNLLPANLDNIQDQPILGGVDSLLFSFFDGSSWRETWNGTNETTPLPRAIRLSLTLVETNFNRGNTRPQPIEMVVGLLVEPSTNAQSTAQSSSTGGGA